MDHATRDFPLIVEKLRKELDELEQQRDGAIKKSRDIIRLSGKVITLLNAGKEEDAEELLVLMDKAFTEFMEIIESCALLKHAGFTNNALAEYVEAKVLYSIVKENRIPPPESLEVETIPYLLGIADVIGELKRMALEKIRKEEYQTAWSLVDLMDNIYSNIKELDYPEALLPGFRHKVDVARKNVEDLKRLLIDLDARRQLIKSLEQCKEQVGGKRA